MDSSVNNLSSQVSTISSATSSPKRKILISDLRAQHHFIHKNRFFAAFSFSSLDFIIHGSNLKLKESLIESNVIGRNVAALFKEWQDFKAFKDGLLETGKVEQFKFRNALADSSHLSLITACLVPPGNIAYAMVINVSDRENDELLAEVNDKLDAFIYHASHELRSPLTSLMGLVNLALKETPSPGAIYNYLPMMEEHIQRMDTILHQLKSIRYNETTVNHKVNYDFKKELPTIIRNHSRSKLDLQVEMEVTQDIEFLTDHERMTTILNNIVANAFTYRNTLTQPRLRIRVKVGLLYCSILFKDNGIGINAILKQKVFQLFFRGTELSNGSGLGLYIVKSMIKKLHGRITFESTENVGTTILLTFPNLG